MGKILFEMTCSASILIFIQMLIRAILLHKLPKRTFLAMWYVALFRLLIPFSIPSQFSVYTLYNQMTSSASEQTGTAIIANVTEQALPIANTISNISTAAAKNPIPLILIIWALGGIAFALFFLLTHCKNRKEYNTSLPVDNTYVCEWQKAHPTRRMVQIRQSDKINAPFTYGILKPVVLLPKTMDYKDISQMQYILTHEFTHIKRLDVLMKWLLVIAVCIHWFNPLVWIMYILTNQDIELSCDETVIQTFGQSTKSAYALTLISMEETKSKMTPFCNNFSKNAIEERIKAIMKIKKTSAVGIILAITVVIITSFAFATSAAKVKTSLAAIPNTNFSSDEYDKLISLQFANYETMPVVDYRNKAHTMIDDKKYMSLLERMYFDTQISEMSYTNKTSYFLNNILFPLIAEDWKERIYHNNVIIPLHAQGDFGELDYKITRTILDENLLTVGELDKSIQGVMNDLKRFIESKKMDELLDESNMKTALFNEANRLIKKWENKSLQLKISFIYIPPILYNIPENNTQSIGNMEHETRDFPPGTQSDYDNLLSLMTSDYKQQSVADFNAALLNWTERNFEAKERITMDVTLNNIPVSLTDDELSFVALTCPLSNAQNTIQVNHENYGDPITNPIMQYELSTMEGDFAAFRLWYQLTIQIDDQNKLTIGERDRCLSNVVNGMKKYWNEKSIEDLAKLNEKACRKQLESFIRKNVNSIIHIKVGDMSFEGKDERQLMP